MAINEDQQKSLEEVRDIRSEPVKIETEGVFNQDYLDRDVVNPGYLSESGMEEFLSDPMRPLVKMLGQYLESIKPPMAFTELPKAEHKVKIFRLNGRASLSQIENAIEEFLNDGYCCHMPTVVNDFVIMDFSRRKETEENEREQQTRTDHR